MNSSSSSLTSPCTTISSPPLGTLVTDDPVANFLPKSFATCHETNISGSHSTGNGAAAKRTHLLQIQTKRLETDDGRDKLLLVPLDALDGDDARGELGGLLLLRGLGLGGLLLGVLGRSLLGVDGEGRGRGLEGLGGPYPLVHGRLVLF